MAKLSINGGFKHFPSDEIPTEVLFEMLEAGASILVAGQKAEMYSMGIKDTGMTIDSLRSTKPTRYPNGDVSCKVQPFDSRTRNGKQIRNADIAFINEYGKRGQAARPAISTANGKYLDAVIDAESKVLYNYMDQNEEE